MKHLVYLIFGLIILTSCISGKENVYITTGTDYSEDPPIWTIGCDYDGFNYNIIDNLIKKLGDNYLYEKSEFEEIYTWKDIQVLELHKKPLNLKIIRRESQQKFLDEMFHEIESITVYIDKDGKDLLRPMKFKNRSKTKRFLVNIIE